jgi:nucleotide-binding universal stress UspA family protein
LSSIFSRILVGVDDSEQAKTAAAFAARLAREHRGELVLCHVVRQLRGAWPDSGGAASDSLPDDASARRAHALLDAVAERVEPLGIAAQQRIVEGEAANGIIEVADEMACRLIVVGTHHAVGVQQLLIGSVTNAVLRASTLPVLTIGRGLQLGDQTRRCLERVLVATDDSEPSEAAIEIAFRLPPEDRRKLVFCCVADVDHAADADPDTSDDPTLGNRLTARAQTIADRARTLALARGITAESRVLEGNPSEAINAAAAQEEADLIILGSHGRRGFERLLLGSVAESIVRTAAVPVLVVPHSAVVGITARRKPS